jgi:hypothetical protein
MKKNKSVAGVHLWHVGIRWVGRDRVPFSSTLFITTRDVSIKQAIGKTETFLKHTQDLYPKAQIRSADYRGFLDA